MGGQAMSAALRPFLPADAALLAEIFRDSIETLTRDDYDDDQREAWASAADDEAEFAARLAGALTLIASIDGEVVGFASLAGIDKLDMLYVAPDAAGQGAGTMLVDALERLAGARGAKALAADASDTARPFFERLGYVAQSRNTVLINGEWLANTTMTKTLAANGNVKDGPA
jgi:putative acetyltransferase